MFCLSLLVPINSPHAHNKVTSEHKKKGGGAGEERKDDQLLCCFTGGTKIKVKLGKEKQVYFISFLSLSVFLPLPPHETYT